MKKLLPPAEENAAPRGGLAGLVGFGDFSWLARALAPPSATPSEQDPKYLETLPPRFVVHTVHGTYAKNADWIKRDSALCHTLREQSGWRARVEPFCWSGENSIVERARAAEKFRDHLYEKLNEYPDAHHVVVAHSHGGNVAFWALKDAYVAARMLGVVTLATPFLSAHTEADQDEVIDLGTGLFAGLFVCWAVLFYGLYRGQQFGYWLGAIAAGVAMMAFMWLGAWLQERMQEHAQRLAACMPQSALTSEQVAIVRVQGDEATAAITGVRLAGSIADLIWKLVSMPLYRYVNSMLKVMDYAGMRTFQEQLKANWRKQTSELESLRASVRSDGGARGEQLNLFDPPPARHNATEIS
ncbi:MAG: hypothetical protein ABL931_09215, partial [Usitatibacteraceae bacterium]